LRVLAAIVSSMYTASFCMPAWALPTDYTVDHGSVTSDQPDSSTLNFSIDSEQAILSFPHFDVGASETVQFHFTNPSALSSVLNRVTGGQVSMIAGSLLSNGQVLLINPAGIQIAGTARIEVARGLVVSTLDLKNEDFLAGQYRFGQGEGVPPGLVRNEGIIVLTKPGGLVALLGGAVQNVGSILAETGSVALVAGEQVTLSFDQQGWLAVAVNQPLSKIAVGLDGQPVSSAVEQSGTISAQGGYVLVRASALPGLFNRLVSLPAGLIEAISVVSSNGRIELIGEGGSLVHAGTIRADGSSSAPDAGQVSITADKVLQQGIVTANAAENGQAGSIQVTGKEEAVLSSGSRLEAKASGLNGKGGSVRVRSAQPKVSGEVAFQDGAVIDVSGGSVSGDAGNVELSAATVQFDGLAYAHAQDGYWGGLLLVDPLFLIFNTSVQTAPPNNATGTPDVAFSDPPAAGTTTIEIGDIVGFAQAFFQAVNDITIAAAIVMGAGNSIFLAAGRDIKQNADVTVSGAGTVTMIADRDFIMGSGASISSGSGAVVLGSGDELDLREITSASGDVIAVAGGNLRVREAISTGGAGDIDLVADGDLEGHGHVSMDSAASLTTDTGDIAVLSALLGDPSEAELELRAVTSTSGNISAVSGRGVKVRGNVSTGGAGKILLDGDFDLDGKGTVRMDSGTSLTTTDGEIEILGGGEDDMNLRAITSTTGDICVHSGDTINVRGNIETGGDGMITLWADSDRNGVGTVNQDGSTNDIITDAGQILLWGSGPIKTKNLTSTTGDIFVWATNPTADLSLDGLIKTGGNVELFAGDDILDGNGGDMNVIAGGDAEFIALNGHIGTSGNSLDVDIDGVLDVGAGESVSGKSVNLAGTVDGGIGGPPPNPPFLVTELGLLTNAPVPPVGSVFLNGAPQVLSGPLGAGFDADTVCITGIVPPPPPPPPPPPGPPPAPPPPLILPSSGPAALLDFIFEVENRRRYRGLII